MCVVKVLEACLLSNIEVTLRLYWLLVQKLTPKMTSEAPVSVAECPPLGAGGTPSMCGKAHNHFLSTTKYNELFLKRFSNNEIDKILIILIPYLLDSHC